MRDEEQKRFYEGIGLGWMLGTITGLILAIIIVALVNRLPI